MVLRFEHISTGCARIQLSWVESVHAEHGSLSFQGCLSHLMRSCPGCSNLLPTTTIRNSSCNTRASLLKYYKSLISLQFCIPCRLFCLYGAEDALIQVQFLKFNLWSNFLGLGLAFPRLWFLFSRLWIPCSLRFSFLILQVVMCSDLADRNVLQRMVLSLLLQRLQACWANGDHDIQVKPMVMIMNAIMIHRWACHYFSSVIVFYI